MDLYATSDAARKFNRQRIWSEGRREEGAPRRHSCRRGVPLDLRKQLPESLDMKQGYRQGSQEPEGEVVGFRPRSPQRQAAAVKHQYLRRLQRDRPEILHHPATGAPARQWAESTALKYAFRPALLFPQTARQAPWPEHYRYAWAGSSEYDRLQESRNGGERETSKSPLSRTLSTMAGG